MGDPRFPKRFAAADRPGAYLRVLREGDVGAGDEIVVSNRPQHGVSSGLIARALLRQPELLGEALHACDLSVDLRAWMQERLARRQ